MPRIERYTKKVIKRRAIPQLHDPSAVSNAASMWNTMSDVTGKLGTMIDNANLAKEKVAVNKALIDAKKQKAEYLLNARQENMGTPEEFAKRIEPELAKIDESLMAGLTSSRAKSAYKSDVMSYNANLYTDNMKWELDRGVQMAAEQSEQAALELGNRALIAGRSGQGLSDIHEDAKSTIAAAGNVTGFTPEAISKMNRSVSNTIQRGYANGLMETNPAAAMKYLTNIDESWAISSGDRANMLAQAGKSVKKISASVERAKRMEAALSSEPSEYLDPGSKDDRDLVDDWFISSGVADGMAEMEPESLAAVREVFKKTNIIPDVAKGRLRAAMYNGTKEDRKAAYSFVGALVEDDPVAVKDSGGFSEKALKEAEIYNRMVRVGATTDYALETIKRTNDPLTEEVRKVREEEYRKMQSAKSGFLASGKNPLDEMKDYYDKMLPPDTKSLWRRDKTSFIGTQNQDAIQGMLEVIYKEEFLRTGEPDAAFAGAMAQIRPHVGVSNIGGRHKIMLYPPESYYRTPGESASEASKWIGKQFDDVVKKNGHEGDYEIIPHNSSPSRFDSGMKPLYQVLVKNEYGYMEKLRGEDNLPLVLEPDVERRKRELVKARVEKILDKTGYTKVDAGPGKWLTSKLQSDINERKLKEKLARTEFDLKDGESIFDAADRIRRGITSEGNK